MEKAKPGWYFYVECVNPDCREDIIFAEAPPAQELTQPLRIQGTTVKCPHCNTEHTYPAAQVLYGTVEKNSE